MGWFSTAGENIWEGLSSAGSAISSGASSAWEWTSETAAPAVGNAIQTVTIGNIATAAELTYNAGSYLTSKVTGDEFEYSKIPSDTYIGKYRDNYVGAAKAVGEFGATIAEDPGRAGALAVQGIVHGGTSIVGFAGDLGRGAINATTYTVTSIPKLYNLGIENEEDKLTYENPLHVGPDEIFGWTEALNEAGEIKNIAYGTGVALDTLAFWEDYDLGENWQQNVAESRVWGDIQDEIYVNESGQVLTHDNGRPIDANDVTRFKDAQPISDEQRAQHPDLPAGAEAFVDSQGEVIRHRKSGEPFTQEDLDQFSFAKAIENPRATHERVIKYTPQIVTETAVFTVVTGGAGAAWGFVRGGSKFAQYGDDIARGLQKVESATASAAQKTATATTETAANLADDGAKLVKEATEEVVKTADDGAKATAQQSAANATDEAAHTVSEAAEETTKATLTAEASTEATTAAPTFMQERLSGASAGWREGFKFGNPFENGPKGKALEAIMIPGATYISVKGEQTQAEQYAETSDEFATNSATTIVDLGLDEANSDLAAWAASMEAEDAAASQSKGNLSDFNAVAPTNTGSVSASAEEIGNALHFNNRADGDTVIKLDGALDMSLLPTLAPKNAPAEPLLEQKNQ